MYAWLWQPKLRKNIRTEAWNIGCRCRTVKFATQNTLLVRPGRGASQVEKSPRLNWATQFFRWHTMVHVILMFLSEWREFPSAPCLAEKKTWWQLTSRCCWNRARRLTCFLSASVTRKVLQFGTWTDRSFQRHYRFSPTTSGSSSG